MTTQAPTLQPGERVRLTSGGPVYTVTRVSKSAAYLRGGETRTVTVTDRKTGEERTFEADASRVLAISPHAFVERVQ